MEIREATVADIAAMQRIRLAVTENRLTNPAAVTARDYEDYIRSKGRGWVGLVDGVIRGFVFLNTSSGNVWALFVEPGYERLGLGRRLHDTMIEWALAHGPTRLWLTTNPGTRAESFYCRAGWRETARTPDGQIHFERSSAFSS